ncbi:MAG: iron-containing redox enzyme family protein [Actinomycetota bacterium]
MSLRTPATASIAVRLDATTAAHRLLQHPFYKAWSDGRLDLDDITYYSTQYWRQVEAFPGYLEALARRLPRSKARSIVLANLADERDGNHPGLWLRFAETVGARTKDVLTAREEPETEACVDAFRKGVKNGSTAFGLGMLYGYESQTPEVSATKIAGLSDHYGISGDGLKYFALHGELDVEHSAQLAQAIDDVVGDETDLDQAEAGARAGAEAIWGLLDGVVRARAIAC